MQLVMPRLKHVDLREFNSERCTVFVDAEDPDDACYKALHKLAETIIKQDKTMVKAMPEIFNDIRVKKIWTPK